MQGLTAWVGPLVFSVQFDHVDRRVVRKESVMLEVQQTQTGFAVVRVTTMFAFGGAEHVQVLSEHATEAEALAALEAAKPLNTGDLIVVTATPPADYTGDVPQYVGPLVCTTIEWGTGRKGVVIYVLDTTDESMKPMTGFELAFGETDFTWERA